MVLQENIISLINQAKIEKKKYNWNESAKLYEQAAVAFVDKEMTKTAANLYKKVGDTYMRAVLGAETKDKYIGWKDSSIKAYKKAEDLYKQSKDELLSLECFFPLLYQIKT
ncbi:hypothetical protein LCGC14_1502430 [marine sediment metagenome]|uniref:MIT domain-containing protein n=1 Tax=marine sediment metagenome TaxID=412755 RepID=A0A0F9M552_9ZZZZ